MKSLFPLKKILLLFWVICLVIILYLYILWILEENCSNVSFLNVFTDDSKEVLICNKDFKLAHLELKFVWYFLIFPSNTLCLIGVTCDSP